MSKIHSWDTSWRSQELSNLMSSALHNFRITQQWNKKKALKLNTLAVSSKGALIE